MPSKKPSKAKAPAPVDTAFHNTDSGPAAPPAAGAGAPAMQRAAFRREIGVAKRVGLQERVSRDGNLRLEQLERIAPFLQPLAIVLGLVPRLARNAQEAARIEMAFTEVGP